MSDSSARPALHQLTQYNPSVAQFLWYVQRAETADLPRDVLDCAAGGSVPPLGLFAAQGYNTCGIDLSDAQVERAMQWAERAGLALGIEQGDMRALPFASESFTYVYEWHSLCHLSREDIGRALMEMVRVLRTGGYLYAEFALTASWPKESPPSDDSDPTSSCAPHTYFTVQEVERLLGRTGLRVVWSQERSTRYPASTSRMDIGEWLAWREKSFPSDEIQEWENAHPERARRHAFVECAVICTKPRV